MCGLSDDRCIGFTSAGWRFGGCKATSARHRPERQYNTCANCRKQCSPNETKSYSNPTPPRKRQNNPINGHTPRRMKPTHTRLTYTRMRPHAPSHQAGDHPVPAHTERHNASKVWTQRQSGFPPRCLGVCHRATCTTPSQKRDSCAQVSSVPDVNRAVPETRHDRLLVHHGVVYSVYALDARAKLARCSESLTPCSRIHSSTAYVFVGI